MLGKTIYCYCFLAVLSVSGPGCGGNGGGPSQDGQTDRDTSGPDMVRDPADDGAADPLLDGQPDMPPDSVMDLTAEDAQPSDWADEICARMITGLCDFIAACCNASEAALQETEWNLDCDAIEASTGYTECYAWVSGILASPHAHVDAAGVEACLSNYADYVARCPGPAPVARYYLMTLAEAGGCSGMFYGDLAQGQSCGSSYECAPELYCDDSCTPRGSVGAGCTAFDECSRDLFCGSSGTCVVPGGEGAPCLSVLDCRLDLNCDTTATPGACRPFKQASETCTLSTECASGTCDTSSFPGTCTSFCDGGG